MKTMNESPSAVPGADAAAFLAAAMASVAAEEVKRPRSFYTKRQHDPVKAKARRQMARESRRRNRPKKSRRGRRR